MIRQRQFIFLAMVFLFLTACSRQPQEVLLDSFEGVIDSKTVDFGTSKGATQLSVSASLDQKVCGEQSLRISYDLKPSGYMWIARGFGLDVLGAAQWLVKPEDIKWEKFNAIVFSMYGTGSGNVIAFDLKDSGGELWRFMVDDDFRGWKEIVCPFNVFFPRTDWQPPTAERNDLIDFPIMSFQFEPKVPGQATYYFDCMKVSRLKIKK